MNSFQYGMKLFQIRMNSFQIGMNSLYYRYSHTEKQLQEFPRQPEVFIYIYTYILNYIFHLK